MSLNGKVAVVTGASKGLGRAIALELANAGCNVVLLSRNLDLLKQVAKDAGSKALALQCDVCDEDELSKATEAIRERFGKIHILVNNAGINIRKNLVDFSPAEWRQVIDTNLVAPFLVSRAFIPLMMGQGYGRIINLTSIMSHVALPGRTAYAASKAGLLGLTRALALELAPEKITVNGISPGPVATEINRPILDSPAMREDFIRRIPVGRWGEETEIAKLALYLCSEASAFITGTDICIDGGWTAQ